MKTCPKCQKKNLNGSQICEKCGAALQGAPFGLAVHSKRQKTLGKSRGVPIFESSSRDLESGSYIDSRQGKNNDKRTFETARNIEITRKTIKFGDSVYQFRNVTGFKVGEVPKEPFPLQFFIVLCVLCLGFLFLGQLYLPAYIISVFSLVIIFYILSTYFGQITRYALVLSFNSGKEYFFISNDRHFLMQIVSTLYDFMEEQIEGSIYVDMSHRSVHVGGDFYGEYLTAGDGNVIDRKSLTTGDENIID